MKLNLLYHSPQQWAQEVAARLRELGVSDDGVSAAIRDILKRAER